MTKKVLFWVALGAGVIGVLIAGIFLRRYWIKNYAPAQVMSVVRLDDGSMLALEEVTTERRSDNPTTGQVDRSEDIDYRLRRYDEKTGKDQARRLIDGMPECVAAKAGRAWCRWGDSGLQLLDAKLESVAGVKTAGLTIDELETDRDGGLLAMGDDGIPARIDPATLEVKSLTDGVPAKKVLPRGMVVQIARAGNAHYELSKVKGQERFTVHVQDGETSKTLGGAKATYIADGFLADADTNLLAVKDAVFLVHRKTIKPDSARTLTRLDLTGKAVWSKPLPEAVDTVELDGDVIVLIGKTQTLGLAAADGAERYRTPHD